MHNEHNEITYEVKRPCANPTRVGMAEAVEGLRLIKGRLDCRPGWDGLDEFEMGRAETVDIGRHNKLGESPRVLRFDSVITTDSWNKLEAAVQHSGALVRTQAIYNASPVESRGKIIIIANKTGRRQIAKAVQKNLPKAAGHSR